jgi:cell division septum initiation protein DivIVA
MNHQDDQYDEIDRSFDDAFEENEAVADNESSILIRRVIDIVASAKALPLSSSVRIEPDEVLELLHRAVDFQPQELTDARYLLNERDQFLKKVQREADEILEDAKARSAQLVSRQEIVKEAKRTATKLVDDAESESRRKRHDAADWCDQQLARLELVLDRIGKTSQAGRERLRQKLEPGTDHVEGLDLAEDHTSASFFDQET